MLVSPVTPFLDFGTRNSILSNFEVPFQAMPEQSRSYETVSCQADKRQSAILACNSLAGLPYMQNDVIRLITILLLASQQKTVQ